jgi:hypothetical protein
VVNLDPFLDSHELQAAAHRGMLDRAILVYVFDFGVGNAAVIFKKWRKMAASDVATLVNRSGEDGAAVLTVPNGIIRATAKKRNAKWGAGDDHTVGFLL